MICISDNLVYSQWSCDLDNSLSSMGIRLRLAMHGHRHRKVFHLVAIDSRLRREAKPAELLGVYDPHSKEDDARVIRWSVDRIRYWLKVGAKPSKSVLKMLELASYPFFFSLACPNVIELTYEYEYREVFSNLVRTFIRQHPNHYITPFLVHRCPRLRLKTTWKSVGDSKRANSQYHDDLAYTEEKRS